LPTLHSRLKKVLVPGHVKGMKIGPPNAGIAAIVTQLGGINVQVSAPEILGALEVSFPPCSSHHINAQFRNIV
jgi:TRAP-type transport system periplasmic protein